MKDEEQNPPLQQPPIVGSQSERKIYPNIAYTHDENNPYACTYCGIYHKTEMDAEWCCECLRDEDKNTLFPEMPKRDI